MTDQPTPAAPFSFRSAQPKPQKGGDAPASTRTITETQPPAEPTTQPAARRRRGPNKPKPDQPTSSIKVDLAEAIAAAALLAESDASAFASIVKTLNGQPAAARRRIAKALARIFGAV